MWEHFYTLNAVYQQAVAMLKMLRADKNLSRLLVFSCTCLLVIFLALPWVNAKEAPKPKLQEWQLNGTRTTQPTRIQNLRSNL
jgi:hypothetical protein